MLSFPSFFAGRLQKDLPELGRRAPARRPRHQRRLLAQELEVLLAHETRQPEQVDDLTDPRKPSDR